MHGQIHVTLFSTSLLNRANLVVMWVTWVRELPGSVGAWVTWIKIFFYVGQHFTWVLIFTWVKYIFAWVRIIYVGPKFLQETNFFLHWSTFIY